VDVTVIVATYGDDRWHEMAMKRAVESAKHQAPVRVMHVGNGVGLSEVRNRAVAEFDPQGWICFLDGDDELEPGYIDHMDRATGPHGQLMIPAIRYVRPGAAWARVSPRVFRDRDIIGGLNPCPIGTLIHRSVFDDIGGFWPERAWEDWSLFRRAVLAGVRLAFVPNAVYRCHVSNNGRNSTVSDQHGLRAEIIESHDRWLATR
jgi:GT2 family glycosyltransferase